MNRAHWLLMAVVGALSACALSDNYAYRPKGEAFSTVPGSVSGELRLEWTPEWIEWAKSNHVQLIGFFASSEGCATSDKPYLLQNGADISIVETTIRIAYDNGEFVKIDCQLVPKKFFFTQNILQMDLIRKNGQSLRKYMCSGIRHSS
jgi:hypothetical protein